MFEGVQIGTTGAELRPDDHRLVIHPKNEPASLLPVQVCLVAQTGEVLAKVVKIKILLGFLELEPFSFLGKLLQPLQDGLQIVL